MKVGLVPLLYNEYNYGGVLQFYAIQRVLSDNQIASEIIYFKNDEKIASVQKKESVVLKIKKNVYRMLHKKAENVLNDAIIHRKIAIDNFKKINYSCLIDADTINYKEYDAVLCGSDQIWNPNWARRRCFLEFVPDDVNKIIYAASLGVESMNDEEKSRFKPRIQRLQHVSVREYSAKRILDSFCEGKSIEVVLDPTLLLTANEWKSIVNISRVPKEKYVFTYFLGDYSKIKEHISVFAISKGLKVLNIPFASGERVDNENYGDIKIYDAGPDEFLGLIQNAEYVFTDSFHACVFSTIFEKNFYVLERDGSKSMTGRINTLFKNTGIPERYISNTEIIELPSIDYSDKEKNIEVLRRSSLRYLLESINERK